MLKNGILYLYIIILAGVISVLIIGAKSFPYTSISAFFILVNTFIFSNKKQKNWYNWVYCLSILILSAFQVLRANEMMAFFNTFALLYLSAINVFDNKTESSLSYYLVLPVKLALDAIKTFVPVFASDIKTIKNIKRVNLDSKFKSGILPSIIITILMLFVVLPILSSANSIFRDLMINFLSYVTPSRYLAENIIWRVVVFTIVFVILRSAYVITNKKFSVNEIKVPEHFLTIPRIVLSLVIFIFLITQIELYMANVDTLRALDLSFADRTNEIFGQLALVSLIIFFFTYTDTSKHQFKYLIDGILLTEIILLNLSALNSLYIYINGYGLTHDRILGITVIIWITVLTILIALKILGKLKYDFAKSMGIITVFTLIFVNLLNFDAIIYNFALTHKSQDVDFEYLDRLSADSNNLRNQLVRFEQSYLECNPNSRLPNTRMVIKENIYSNDNITDDSIRLAEELKNKYGNEMDFRTFNYSEYKAFLSIKDVDLDKYRKAKNDCNEKISSENNRQQNILRNF